MGLACKDALEIFVENDSIILKKYLPNCIFCGSTEGLKNFEGKSVCRSCIRKLQGEL